MWIKLVHGRDNRDEFRSLSTQCCKGMTCHSPGIDMSCVGCDDSHDFALEFRDFGFVQEVIYAVSECFRLTFIPASGNG